ncbi:DUF3054 domain-containing protein [Corynebacterium otitidis]|uniref:Uncharacterized protein n=1 Tax=Corynebacterium otitidis ATCC 51513 TaxID=883169 RepID=K0YQ36_9CORY|nr:DUF3054 domain-containing protein [Corynebacterium otitidis]EJZ81614.1 hypothetical protein HMPREF9719_01435 [Corynebacterium otitidis ATCC 51513]
MDTAQRDEAAASTGGAPRARRIPTLVTAGLDAAALALFALAARIAHNSPDTPLTFGSWAATLMPFLIGLALGWAILAAGAARREHADGRGSLGALAAPLNPGGLTIWLSTSVVGLLVWSLIHNRIPHWSFPVVATLMCAVLFLGWRGVVAAARRFARRG